MRFDVLTIFPELFEAFSECSLIGRARRKQLMELEVADLRSFTTDRHRTVDDEAYGGGGGMVMKAEPWLAAVRAVSEQHASKPYRILLSPQGTPLTEAKVRELATRERLLLLCGRYEAIDERVNELVVDEEISIGDYVLSGGELAAMVLIEAVSRQIPGVVGLAASVHNDSFREGLLDYPHYTRPETVEGLAVPKVLRQGDHGAIARWRQEQAEKATRSKRPDLWRRWVSSSR